MKRSTIITLVSLLLVVGSILYVYVFNSVQEPFSLSSSVYTNNAGKLVGTTQRYQLRFENSSDKTLRLSRIDLAGYRGIEIKDLQVNGQTLTTLQIPSDRIYNSSGSWSTSNGGIVVTCNAKILETNIQNPTTVTLTYSYFGIKHQQVLKVFSQPNEPGFIFQTTNSRLERSIFPFYLVITGLVFLYWKRSTNEPYLSLKLVGYSIIGSFNITIIYLILPVGFLLYRFFRPVSNKKIKYYAALIGSVGMALSYLLPLIFKTT